MAQILIIEDTEVLRTVVGLALRRMGHRVEEAADGAAGVERFRAMNPDLVITDLLMPEKDGVEVIEEILEEDPQARILVISGRADLFEHHDPLTRVRAWGARGVLAKPFSLGQLEEAVQELLHEGERARRRDAG